MKKTYKIEGLFEYCMRNKDYRYHYRDNNNYDDAIKAQKDFLNIEGYNNIINLIKEVTKDYEHITLNIISKKYNRSNYDKYIKIELINNNDNIYTNKYTEQKEIEYKINNILFEHHLFGMFEVVA